MALQQVNFGSASDGSQGDTARAAFGRINQNFSDQSNAAARLIGLAAGNVMEVGAFGLGATSLAVLANLDSMTTVPGWYRVTSATTGTLPTSFGVVRIDSYAVGTSNDNWAFQTCYGTNGRIYFRSSINLAAWSTWREFVVAGSSPTLGSLTVAADNASASMNLSGGAAQVREFVFKTQNSNRFGISINSDPESGSNAGSNLTINRYSDSGAYQDQPLRIERTTGESRVTRLKVLGPSQVGQYVLASLPSAAAFPGYEIDVTDASGGAKRCRSDGTNWKIINTTTTVS